MPEPAFDRDGYPTEETLKAIEQWPYSDIAGLIDFVFKAWHENGLFIETDYRLQLITGGWSGNESIIGAMMNNHVIWSHLWLSSHRGGKHVLEKFHA